MDLGIAELFSSPDHYLFMFDGDQAIFRPMDRAAYGRSIFLDERIQPAATGSMRIPLAPLLGHVRPDRSPSDIGWIFHVAHCGSTLLARGLDCPDASLVLREPAPLRQLALEGAAAFAGRPATAAWRQGLALAVGMMGKAYAPVQRVLVKANVPVNFILSELMAQTPEAKGVVLYFEREDYLVAILRSAEHRRWLRYITAALAPALVAEVGPIDGLEDGELAAALWLAQMRIFTRALERWPQLRSLDAGRLLANPSGVVEIAAAYFDMPAAADEATMQALAVSYAKNPELPFDNEARIKRRRIDRQGLAPELDRARSWLAARGEAFAGLPRPL